MFGRLFTARELYDYFVNAQRLTLKRTHAWTNQRRQAQNEQHHELTGQWGLGRKTPIDSPDYREVDALAEAARQQASGWGSGREQGSGYGGAPGSSSDVWDDWRSGAGAWHCDKCRCRDGDQ